MLITSVEFPPILNDSFNTTFLEYLSRVSVLSTLLLKFPKKVSPGTYSFIEQYISSMGIAFAEGFSMDDDENVTKLLDSGLQVAFFTYSKDMSTDELEILKKVAKSLPRSRIGICLNEPINPDSMIMSETISQFSDVVSHFSFKCNANCTNQEHQKILKCCKELINNVGFAIQICFELPIGTSETIASTFATFMDGIHVAAEMTITCDPNYATSQRIHPSPWPTVFANPYSLHNTSYDWNSQSNILDVSSKKEVTPGTAESVKVSNSSTLSTNPPQPPAVTVTAVHSPGANSSFGTGSVSILGSLDLISVFVACLRSDRSDRLFTTVVCDEHGVCLGLVYSNEESLRVAVIERRGVYWSRSRNSLWRKGDSSGMYQELIDIKVDCDYDALRFTVYQRGDPPSFCHLMTRTCWGHVTGIKKLETILMDRKKSAPEGSYTKRLFDDPDLLRKKLLEEVQELVEAQDPDHVAAEAADVLYFAMTRCVAAGVGLTEIEQHLDRRTYKVTRRPGNAKEWRTKNAEDILAKATTASTTAIATETNSNS